VLLRALGIAGRLAEPTGLTYNQAMAHPLDLFSEPVRLWFLETFGQPTPPQAQGWPAIQAGQHTLILAPTGSGKTLAAFLWGIDQLYRELGTASAGSISTSPAGIRLLYVSPLKALNNDIERNLRTPLAGIRALAERQGRSLPALRVAVRTGDTPSSARAAMLKQPPHILITTPESLYLMLTSPRARELFRSVRTVIVDEIHTLCGDKRGVHLALSLERLQHLAAQPIQRIGLSATIRPLDEAARFLGGQEWSQDDGGPARLVPRPVTVVDAGYRKPLDLQVVTPVEDFRRLPGKSIWLSLIPRVLRDIMRHRSTLIFCNNRRLAERTADRLNAQITAERAEEVPPGSTEALAPAGLPRDRGIFAIGAEGPIRAHHGSMSKEARRQMEEDLKAGRLPALVGTSTLELGIDIGAIDLVVQIQSPKSVAQGLQRVGRSGHLVGQTSVGRIYATYQEELDEAAAVARGMLEGDVEPTTTPRNPLDVLAQQVVAMVAVEEWSVPALFDLVRQAYPYRDLSPAAFRSVLEMLSGRYALVGGQARTALRARIAWDRVNDRLSALPGSRLLALANAGTIPDTGAYDVYLADGKTKVGQLDEEFVFETRVGDTFLLGSNTWRVLEIADDRIVVADAAGAIPRMPFWRGDYPWRPYELGRRVGRLRRELAERIAAAAGDQGKLAEVEGWLQREYLLDENSARNLVSHVRRQLDAVGVIASDQTIVVESFQDALGEPRLVVHSPFGGRVNAAWALALSSALSERVGIQVEVQANDDGILLRFPSLVGEPPIAIVQQMTPAEARQRILAGLPGSAVFGAHFRMNAARALLLPKARGRKRTPFWLQRLKAKDLLATVSHLEDFPLLAETYRDCLQDVLDLPHLEQILADIQAGQIRVVPIQSVVPSPVAAGLLQAFMGIYMYEWDVPKAERQLQALSVQAGLVDELLGEPATHPQPILKPEAVAEFTAQTQRTAPGYRARSADELATFLLELGDLTTEEVAARCAGDAQAWLAQLMSQGRLIALAIPAPAGPVTRWVPAELAQEYKAAWQDPAASEAVLRRYLRNRGPVTRDEILARYPFEPAWLDEALARLVASGEILQGHFIKWEEAGPCPELPADRSAPQLCDRHNLEQLLRRTLASLRREVQPVPLAAYADFLLRWQGLYPDKRRAGEEGLRQVMGQLRGVALPGPIWERDVLPARLADYQAGDLNALCASGELLWVASGRDPRRARITFFSRGEGGLFLQDAPLPPEQLGLSETACAIYAYLRSEGASFLADLEAGLGRRPAELQDGLAELVLAGLVTNDTLDGLHAILAHAMPAGEAGLSSSLEAELARLRGGAHRPLAPGRMSRDRLHAARRRVAHRLKATLEPGFWPGRWSLVHRPAVWGPMLSDDERADKVARLLLARYGVVMRESIEREGGPWDWTLLAPRFQRMEMRGEVRRGYFVAGLSGVQYALPEAVEELRAGALAPGPDVMIVVNAADPANVYGGESGEGVETTVGNEASSPPGLMRFARLPSTHCVLYRGQPILVAEDNGERLVVAQGVGVDVIQRGLQAYLARPNAPRHAVVRQWNGAPVLGSPGEAILQTLGFYRTPTGLEWWAG